MLKTKIPKHLAIIMDGNGRWAEMRGLPRHEGHKRGVKRIKEVIEKAQELGIEILSLYAFSLENWARPESEVSFIMNLMESTLKGEFLNLLKEGIRFRVLGNRERLPKNIRDTIESIEDATKQNNKLILQCALSYGGRDEIIRAIRKAIQLNLSPDDITENTVEKLLDTSGLPDPDLIIRTSGEQRLSNFLLWQSAYAEFYFTKVLWPDFTKEELMKAINEYQKRDRRFGNIRVSDKKYGVLGE